ncbi:cell division protein ZapE [Lysobacter solisilvae (ex Woo and Kim 2022)]|uniref:Cell division protein ZapE n=1 Tax=Agrilutibacter terrestris TaxID=2865112 RepID=A0A7H0FTR7_9GAMM|nr:cell division protein ZapE [Lysobacter terrestris]QNP39433.1 cell division protein ZapE [Lysobacter terrestris]
MTDSTLLPSQRYAQGVARGDWNDDPAQHAALRELDRLHALLLQPAKRGLFDSLLGRKPETPTGLYLWGGVGRGKTFLIDLFFDGLTIAEKRRTHFHRFMREVHAALREHAGESDPLAQIAREWRRDLRVLVLDEFFVNDIGDAMLLGRLLERLFAEGVALVTSSNTAPANLYAHGLQRERFLPAIAQLQAHTVELLLDSPNDYRLRALTKSPVYRTPLDAQSDTWLAARWRELTAGLPQDPCVNAAGLIEIDGREIPVRATCEGHAWFDFAALCEGPRAAGDYIEIATEHHTVLLGDIPQLDDTRNDAARRFVHLIDELYDRHVNLVCTAAAAPTALYVGSKLGHAFERTTSRLIEMQSAEYLALEHRG